MVKDNTQLIVGIGIAVFIIATLGSIFVMLGPTLFGVGTEIATSTGTNTSEYYNASVAAAVAGAEGYGAANTITPYLAIAFGILSALGISLASYFKGVTSGRKSYSR